MRVISGSLKGRVIKGYNIEGTRPTMDRVKASLFASIQNYINDSVVLDLFAGSGSLGIEAISNGASSCYFVDNNSKCISCIKGNIDSFNISSSCYVYNMDYNRALSFFNKNNIKFDIIFIDPPYNYNNINSIVDIIDRYNLVKSNSLLVLEYRYDKIDVDKNKYILLKSKKYGDKYISIYKKL